MSEENKLAVVQLKVIETKPAVVTFNYQEISDHLDSVLEKYRGLVFTDATIADCKKTIAELRKGQKSLDEFRKTTKKQLTESVTAFENQCKTLYGKFDEVIQPLTLQQQKFENERREKKRAEIQSIIDGLIAEHGLAAKYITQLVIPEEYFNVGKSMKAIKTELSALANTLKIQQDKEDQDINLVRTKVELACAQYQLYGVLVPGPYLRLLQHKSVAEIEELIISDAKELRAPREKEAAEQAEAPVVVTVIPPEPETVITAPPVMVFPITAPATVSASVPTAGEMITAVYEITGTDAQLSALEAYLDANGLKWADRPNG